MENLVTRVTGSSPVARTALAPELRARCGGQVIAPDDPGYEQARRVWNGMIDRRPAALVQALDEVDVREAIRCASRFGLPLSVRGGGHNVAGRAVCDNGIMLDLGKMNAVQVDPGRRVARVQGGALWSDLDAATAAFGLATTGGVIPSTGVAGLVLGGGIGWLVGTCGMSVDNLLGATVVTAGGEIIEANVSSHPDLFWALRGGGGNFGVVVSLELQLHPIETVLAGFVAWPASDARNVLARYRDLVRSAPEGLTAYAQIATDPESGERIVAIAVCWTGDMATGERLVAPLRDVDGLLVDAIGPMPYLAWQNAFEHEFPHGRRYYWKSNLLAGLDDGVLEALVAHGIASPLPWTTVAIECYAGPMNRVPPDATAFPHRDARFQVVASSGWDDGRDDAAGITWARTIHDAVQPWSLGGRFLNFNPGDNRTTLANAIAGYGDNLPRLRQVKRRYDPGNLFSGNSNIPPADD
jgi:FAD/FMN-containing dehydrogenase